jgi:hypothetical protein
MRRSIPVFALAIVLTFGVVSFGVAQTTGSSQGHPSTMKADSTSKSGQKDTTSTMQNMSGDCRMMLKDFDQLQEHFDKMMQMNDMDALKSEMKKHQEMMLALHEKLSKHQSMCQNMMSMMQSGSKQGTGGTQEKQPKEKGQHSQSH